MTEKPQTSLQSSRSGPTTDNGADRPPQRRANADGLRRRKRMIARWRTIGVRAWAAIMVAGTLVGALFFARPEVSALEKRELTSLPTLSAESFFDGSYFTGLSLWYSDTYPLRELLVGASQRMGSLFGIEPSTQLVGGNVAADVLPPEGEGAQGADAQATEEDQPVEVPFDEATAAEIQQHIMNGLYVKNGAAYSLYYFSKSSVERYAKALNSAAARLEGNAHVYSIIVPNNSAALLSDEELADLGGTDQDQATKYFYSLYDNVTGIDVLDRLREHRDEYTYFRTDHHWTQLGAYYAYQEYCKAAGLSPVDMSAWELKSFSPFLGSFYTELGNAEMAAAPDTVEARVPPSTNEMTYWDAAGVEHSSAIITDVSDWNQNSLYNTFVAGDQPLTRIDNPDLDDGSACLVVKDSFGCCFLPLLVENYQTVWAIDFRYSDRSIPDFVEEHSIVDVLFVNNIAMAGTDPVSNRLLAQCQ